MVIHNFQCPSGHITEKMIDVNEQGWKEQSCSTSCELSASHVYLSKRVQILNRKPITIYRNSSGEVRFPGSADEAIPANYKAEGFQRVEMTYHEAQKFQKDFNRQEQMRDSDKKEFMHYLESERNAEDRSDLLHSMRGMSSRGRDFAAYCIEQNNKNEAQKYYSNDPGFHIEILES